MPESSLETGHSCFVEKTAPKNTSYSRNDKFLKIAKIGPNGRAIGFAKWSFWLKNGQKRGKSCLETRQIFSVQKQLLMYQSNRSLNIPPGQPPGHLNFWKIFVQIPPSRG